MNMKKTIYTVIATLLFLISSCTLEQIIDGQKTVQETAEQLMKLIDQLKCLLRFFSVGDF